MQKKIMALIVCFIVCSTILPVAQTLEKKENIHTEKQIVSSDGSGYSSISVDDNSVLSFGVSYVNDYVGRSNDLWLCDDEADYMYNKLVDRGWLMVFRTANYLSRWKYWSYEMEEYNVDWSDLVMFRGHGTASWDGPFAQILHGPMFREDSSTDYKLTPGDAYDRYGNWDNEWVAFGCCNPLIDGWGGYWAAAMNGCHMILGYKTTAHHVRYATEWMKKMLSSGTRDPAKRVAWSWFKACDLKQGRGRIARIVGEHWNMLYDYLWGQGLGPQPDPIDDRYYYCWDHQKGTRITAPSVRSQPRSMTYYEVIPKNIDETYVSSFGNLLGLSGSVDNYNDGSYYMADGETYLEVSETEGIDYGNASQLWIPYEQAPTLPTHADALVIAEDFLLQKQLLPADAQTPEVIDSDIQAYADEETDEPLEVFPTTIQVGYTRTIDNYPVVGAGSSLLVYITEGGTISGFSKIWRDIQSAGTADIYTEADVLALFDNYRAKVALDGIPYYEDYSINDIWLAYYENGYGEQQDYIIPVYVLDSDFLINNTVVFSDIIIIPAAEQFLPPLAMITTPEDNAYHTYNETITFTGSASYGKPPYTYLWESDIDGYIGDTISVDVSNLSMWMLEDETMPHTITFTVTDSDGNIGVDMIQLHINSPPLQPSITGTTSGKIGTEYNYTLVSMDINQDNIYYYIDWGDGTSEEWIGPYESGQQCTIKHTWNEEETYIIMAKAKDEHEAESDWTTLEVTMQKNKPFNINQFFIRFLEQHPNIFPILRHLLGL